MFSTDLQMQINSLPAGGAVVAGDIAVSLVTAVIKVMCSNATLIRHYRKNEMKITSKLFRRCSVILKNTFM